MPVLKDDCVIDTNVFCHSDNEKEINYYESSKRFLDFFARQETFLCVDDEFNAIESRNRSWIGSEYFKHLRTGTYGYTKLLELIHKGRIKIITRKKVNSYKRKIGKIIRNRCDVIFVCVTIGSDDKVFVSNDFLDFTEDIRNSFKKKYKINICSSNENPFVSCD